MIYFVQLSQLSKILKREKYMARNYHVSIHKIGTQLFPTNSTLLSFTTEIIWILFELFHSSTLK